MLILLQGWAGLFYLLNKIFLAFSESKKMKNPNWRKRSWIVYIIGLPAWVIIFIIEHNWIAAALELSGLPSMILGLILTLNKKPRKNKSLDYFAVFAIIVGSAISLYDFGGLNKLTQYLELGIVIGFLFGTYKLAKNKASGYLWFLLMNSSNATLMYIEAYPFLAIQQIISFGFVAFAYTLRKFSKNIHKNYKEENP